VLANSSNTSTSSGNISASSGNTSSVTIFISAAVFWLMVSRSLMFLYTIVCIGHSGAKLYLKNLQGQHTNLRIQLPPSGHSAHVEDIVVSETAIAQIFLYPGLCNLPGSGFTFLLAVASFFSGSGKFFYQWELYNWQWECLVHFIPNIIHLN
nr:hypothetical protein [Tanacetum cinerariifolium]